MTPVDPSSVMGMLCEINCAKSMPSTRPAADGSSLRMASQFLFALEEPVRGDDGGDSGDGNDISMVVGGEANHNNPCFGKHFVEVVVD